MSCVEETSVYNFGVAGWLDGGPTPALFVISKYNGILITPLLAGRNLNFAPNDDWIQICPSFCQAIRSLATCVWFRSGWGGGRKVGR